MSEDPERDLSRHPFLWPLFLDRNTAEYQARSAAQRAVLDAQARGEDLAPHLDSYNRRADQGRMLDEAPKPDRLA